MYCLRYDFASGFAGWVPSMGRTARCTTSTGVPHVDPGTIDYPVAVKPRKVVKASRNATGRAGVRVGILDTRLYPHPSSSSVASCGRSISWTAMGPIPTSWTCHLHRRPDHDPCSRGHAEVRQTLDDRHATTTVWDLARAMMEFRDSGVQILNLSLGCFTGDGRAPMVLNGRCSCSPGTSSSSPPPATTATRTRPGQPRVDPANAFWPAALDDVVAVGATVRRKNGTLIGAPFSPQTRRGSPSPTRVRAS